MWTMAPFDRGIASEVEGSFMPAIDNTLPLSMSTRSLSPPMAMGSALAKRKPIDHMNPKIQSADKRQVPDRNANHGMAPWASRAAAADAASVV
mmetsp:Transcript_40701/g.93554  ORF Transcript_40701/g.93554 Transcript_40701/m.93554 type:complete len:93 (+) Transcript_40701:954-1232(+)